MFVERELGHEPFPPTVPLQPAAAGGVRSDPDARTSFQVQKMTELMQS